METMLIQETLIGRKFLERPMKSIEKKDVRMFQATHLVLDLDAVRSFCDDDNITDSAQNK